MVLMKHTIAYETSFDAIGVRRRLKYEDITGEAK